MVVDPDSPKEIRRKCRYNGISVSEVQKVRTGVYRGKLSTPQLGNSDDVYLKLYSQRNIENIRTFVDIATQVGHPECLLVEDGVPILVMAAAGGRPLSYSLLFGFFPGVWDLRRERYETVYRKIGEQLARLHAETGSQFGPVLETDEQARGIQLTRYLEGRLSDSIIRGIQDLFECDGKVTTEYAITYGDRSPHNIYTNGSRVVQIDCGCSLRTISYEHVGVIMGIRLMCKRLPYARQSIASTLEEAYWDGYTRVRSNYNPEEKTFTIRYLYRSLKLLELYQSNPGSLNSKLTKRIDQPIIFDEIEFMYAKLD